MKSRGKRLVLAALASVFCLTLGFGLPSATASEGESPTVLADFETGTAEEWFTDTPADYRRVDGQYSYPGGPGAPGTINDNIDVGRKSFQIVPEDYDAAGFGAVPAVSDNKAALIYAHSWNLVTVRIRFPEPYTVTPSTVLTFRIKIHMAPTADNPNWAVILTAYDGTNDMREGYQIRQPFTQDEWVTVTLKGNEINGLIDADGQISGVTVGTSAVINGAGYEGPNGPLNVMLDDFTVSESLELTAPDGAVLTAGTENDLSVTKPDLTRVNGIDNMDTPGRLYDWWKSPMDYSFREEVAGAADGKALELRMSHWRTGGLSLDFAKSIPGTELRSLKLRMYFHMSPARPYIGTLYLFANGTDGAAGTGVALDPNVVQDEWVDVEITGAELEKLLDAEGNLSGLQFGYSVHSDKNHLNWESYVLIDSILAGMPATVSFDDGTAVTEQEAVTSYPAEKIASPVQNGKVFAGWYDGKTLYDFSAPLLGDLTLTAKWLDAADASADVYGLYSGTGGNLMLYPEGTAFLEGAIEEGTLAAFAEGGVVVFDGEERTTTGTLAGDTITYAGQSYTKTESLTVTYEDVGATYVRYILPGSRAEDLLPDRPGYLFTGWTTADGAPFDFEQTVNEDLTLKATWDYDEAETSEWTYATYYADGVKLILKEDGTFVLQQDGAAEEGDYFVLVTSAIVLETEDGNLEGELGKYEISLGGKSLKRLRQYLVSFDPAGGEGDIPEQVFAPGSEYLAQKPADPVREGYVFRGWKLRDGTDFDFTSVITQSITLYAEWEPADGAQPREPGGGCGKSDGASAALMAALLAGAAAVFGKRGR